MHSLLKTVLIATIGIVIAVGVLSNANMRTQAISTAADGSQIKVAGATALQPLVEKAAARFMSKHSDVRILVQGGTGSVGISQALRGQVDIGASDAKVDKLLHAASGDLVEHKVAAVGIAIIVNPSVTITDLSTQQLIDVFTRKVTNWKQLGGPDMHIMLITRDKSSGDRAAFKEHALGGVEEAYQYALVQKSPESVRELVAIMKGAIGYLPLPYVNEEVRTVRLNGVEATADNILSGKYPVWTYEYMYTKGQPKEYAKAFIDYMLGAEVQDTLAAPLGYIPIGQMEQSS